MTRIKIPECSNPFEVTVNGRKYKYEAGIETDVPDDVAKAIEKHHKEHKKEPPEAKAPFGAISFNDLKDKPFYEEVKEVTLLATVDEPCIELDGFPNLEVGDTISLIIDNIEYTLSAFDDYGYTAIGDSWDDIYNGSGNYGCNITQGITGSWFFESKKPTSITYKANLITQIDEQYLPSVYKHIKFNFGEKKLTSHTYNEIYQMVINDIPLIAVDEDNLINKYYLPEYYNSAIRFKRIHVSNNQLKYYELCISKDDSITTNTYFVNLSN